MRGEDDKQNEKISDIHPGEELVEDVEGHDEDEDHVEHDLAVDTSALDHADHAVHAALQHVASCIEVEAL